MKRAPLPPPTQKKKKEKKKNVSTPTAKKAPLPPPLKTNKKGRKNRKNANNNNDSSSISSNSGEKSFRDIELGTIREVVNPFRTTTSNVSNNITYPPTPLKLKKPVTSMNRLERVKKIKSKELKTKPVTSIVTDISFDKPKETPFAAANFGSRETKREQQEYEQNLSILQGMPLILLTVFIITCMIISLYLWGHATTWNNPAEFQLLYPGDTCCRFRLSPTYSFQHNGSTNVIANISKTIMYGLLCVLIMTYITATSSFWLYGYRGRRRSGCIGCIGDELEVGRITVQNRKQRQQQKLKPKAIRYTKTLIMLISFIPLPALLWVILVPPPPCLHNLELPDRKPWLVCGLPNTTKTSTPTTPTPTASITSANNDTTTNSSKTDQTERSNFDPLSYSFFEQHATPDDQLNGYCAATTSNLPNSASNSMIGGGECYGIRTPVNIYKTCGGSDFFFASSKQNFTKVEIELALFIVRAFCEYISIFNQYYFTSYNIEKCFHNFIDIFLFHFSCYFF